MTDKQYGPTVPISEEIHAEKYRGKGESFKEAMARIAYTLKDSEEHALKFKDILYNQRFMPAGRVQSAIGAPRQVTPYNCFVSDTIPDSMNGILDKLKEAAITMQKGGGIGYDFSTLRPSGDLIRSLDSRSSGPISFMDVFNAMCGTISSAGHRRGAQMGVLRVDHPDIEEFIRAKQNSTRLTNFNISVGVTDEFMKAVESGSSFDLVFEGHVYKTVDARALWDDILRATWDWAEPGVLFIDRMNAKNNLWYCETIAATNPCGEQPLPPYGACLLGSFNLVKYIRSNPTLELVVFDYEQFRQDITQVVRAMDNVIDIAKYPLVRQEVEARNKRRMGLGVTGLANAVEAMGHPYGSPRFLEVTEEILKVLRDTAYMTSVELAIEKEPFRLFDADKYLESGFAKTLPEYIRNNIRTYGIRNSHLLSIAPTGTISLSADNVSSGIEPVFSYGFEREINMPDGKRSELVEDYGVRVFGVKGKTADQLNVMDHVKVLTLASKYVDSACSKTCNVGPSVTWDEFKEVYMTAWREGASGCTTFRTEGKRAGILRASKDEELIDDDRMEDGSACYIDPDTGIRSCD